MKQTKFIIIAVVLVAAVVLFLNKDVIAGMLEQKVPADGGGGAGNTGAGGGGNSSTANNVTPSATPATTAAPLDYNKLLKKGVTAPEVAELQKRLNNKGGSTKAALVTDGKFGDKTVARLKEATGGMATQGTLTSLALYGIL